MKLKNGVNIVSLEDRLANVRMLSPFAAGNIAASEKLIAKLKDPKLVSQFTLGGKNDNFDYKQIGDVMPRDEDYITVNFRALSKTIVPGHWIDWTKDNVLQESVQLLAGATVYPNHEFWDINNWLGSVSNSAWDEAGANAQGVPGINAEYKIDALMNPRIARGLLMTPPAIHSTSMTVLFEFDYSHPDMAAENKYKFLSNLGEEVDGEIVRFIVTKIREYWEASLVFQGADRLAKKIDDGSDETDFADMSAKPAAEDPPPNSIQEKTMKLTAEQKKSLGIEFDGEEVPETELLKAGESLAAKVKEFDGFVPAEIASLREKAAAGDKFVEEKRADVVRLATLAEAGADPQAKLDPVIEKQLKAADYDTLVELGTYYQKKVGEKFPASGRSSQEDPKAVENAGGVKETAVELPEVGVF